MPKLKGRGKVVKTRNVKLPGGKEYLTCDVYEKPGPQGGRTSCTKRTKKGKQ